MFPLVRLRCKVTCHTLSKSSAPRAIHFPNPTACNVFDEELTPEKATMAFFVSGKTDSSKLHDFSAATKEAEKRDQAARLMNLQKQRRTELAVASAAVEEVSMCARLVLRDGGDGGGGGGGVKWILVSSRTGAHPG